MSELEFKNLKTGYENTLILEDNPARYEYLIGLLLSICGPIVKRIVITTTAKAAIDELSRDLTIMWGVIMLDHDLDGQVYVVPANPNTGYQVCKYIRDNGVKYDLCIIHTLNEFAAPKMISALQGTGRVIYKPCVDL